MNIETLKLLIIEEINFHKHNEKIHSDYSRDYAHKHLIKNRFTNKKESDINEAFLHEGLSQANGTAARSLEKVLENLKLIK